MNLLIASKSIQKRSIMNARQQQQQQNAHEKDHFQPSMLGDMPLLGRLFFNLEDDTVTNEDYRHVIATTRQAQVVLMSLGPKQRIGVEVHNQTTQFVRVEDGMANIRIGDIGAEQTIYLEAGGENDATLIPAGTRHAIKNPSRHIACKLYIVYCGEPQHPPGLVQHVKPMEDKI